MGFEAPDLLASLRYARLLARDPRPAEENSRAVRWGREAGALLGPRDMFFAGWVCLWIAGLLWLALRIRRIPSLRPWIVPALVLGLVLQGAGAARQVYRNHHA